MTKRKLKTYMFIGILGPILAVILYLTLWERDSVNALGKSENAETIENLRTFAKLFGYIRYFHPSDAASTLDWDRMAIHGVREVLKADGQSDMETVLESLFLPVAPTSKIFFEGETAPTPDPILTPIDTTEVQLAYWQYLGVDLGNLGPYRSIRVNQEESEEGPPTSASFWKRIDARPFRGKTLRLTASAKTSVTGEGNHAQLILYTELPTRQFGFVEDMADRPITAAYWNTYAVTGTVGNDADTLGLGGILAGSGSAWFDDFQLYVRGEGEDDWSPVPLENAGFEAVSSDDIPEHWNAWGDDYIISLETSETSEGNGSLAIEHAPMSNLAKPIFEGGPKPGEIVNSSIGGGLVAQIPLALYRKNGQTIRPDAAPSLNDLQDALQHIDLASLAHVDAELRYADVIILWNVLQHFYPLFDTADADWDQVLTEALERASHDQSAEDFLVTLQWMVEKLNDGHAFIRHPDVQHEARPPFLVDEAEEKVVIVSVAPGREEACFSRGDEVLSIDETNPQDALRAAEALISGSPQWKRRSALREFGYGQRGTLAHLVLMRDGAQIPCDVERSYTQGIFEDRPSSIGEIEDGVFYVNLSAAPMIAIESALAAISSADAVIFDLRGYPRDNVAVLQHLTDVSLRSTDWPIPQIIYPDRDNIVGYDTTSPRWTLPPRAPRIQGKIMFLADANAISQSESILGIVEYYELGEIVGQRTAGVTGNSNPVLLPGGFSVGWTGMRVQKHNGELHQITGIAPTVPVTKTVDGLISGRDEILERALALVRGS